MAPTFFLSRFGISTVQSDDKFSGDTKLEQEPEKQIQKPKISPYHYEVSDSAIVDIIGTQVYAKINGDTDDDESAWVNIYRDEDGDLAVDVVIDQDAWVNNTMYFEFNNKLKEIPAGAKRRNSTGAFVINVDGFVTLNSKLAALLIKVDIPDGVNGDWYLGKYHCDGKGRMTYYHEYKWIPMLLPIDSSFVEGVYSFI